MTQKVSMLDIDRDQIEILEFPNHAEKYFQPDEQGHNLYFTKAESNRYNLSSDEHVQGAYFVRNGQVEWIGHAKLNAGFSKAELEEYAEEQAWELIDEYDGQRWSRSYREATQGTTITVDKPSIVDGEPLNNVFVRSREVPVKSDLRGYDHLKAVAKKQNVSVGVRDSEGLWQRFQDSTDIDAPDLQVLSQIAKKAETVQAHLKFQYPSVWMNLGQLKELVDTINEAISTYPDEYTGENDDLLASPN